MSKDVMQSLREKLKNTSYYSGVSEQGGYSARAGEVKELLSEKLQRESGNRSELERKKEIHALQEQIAELKTLIAENSEYNIKAEKYKAELDEVISKLKEVEI